MTPLELAEAKLRGHAALNTRLVSQVVAANEREKRVVDEYQKLANSMRREVDRARATASVDVDEMVRLHREEMRAVEAEAAEAEAVVGEMREAQRVELLSLRNDLNFEVGQVVREKNEALAEQLRSHEAAMERAEEAHETRRLEELQQLESAHAHVLGAHAAAEEVRGSRIEALQARLEEAQSSAREATRLEEELRSTKEALQAKCEELEARAHGNFAETKADEPFTPNERWPWRMWCQFWLVVLVAALAALLPVRYIPSFAAAHRETY